MDLGIGLQKFDNDGRKIEAAEHDRSAHHESAFWRAVFAGNLAFCFAEFVEQAPAGGKVLLAIFSQ